MSYQVEVLPVTAHPLYDTRESGKTHTPFSLERALCTAIELGDEAAMDRAIADYMAHGFVVGTMSGDRLRQVKYWAVATVAIAIHYACRWRIGRGRGCPPRCRGSSRPACRRGSIAR